VAPLSDKREFAEKIRRDLASHYGAKARYSQAMIDAAMRRQGFDAALSPWAYSLFASGTEFAQAKARLRQDWDHAALRAQMVAAYPEAAALPGARSGRGGKTAKAGSQLGDRLQYALIGLIFGTVLSVLACTLFDLPISLAPGSRDPALMICIFGGGGVFALIGFIFMDKVGDALGNVAQAEGEIIEYQIYDFLWNWRITLCVVVLALMLAAVGWLMGWYGIGHKN
jgi:hypothetical protein